MKHLFISALILSYSYNLQAQTWEEELQKMQKEFDEFSKQTKEDFNNYLQKQNQEYSEYVEKIDKEFSEYLQKTWQEYSFLKGAETDVTPKPIYFPVFDPEKSKKVLKKIPIKAPGKIISPKHIKKPVIPKITKSKPIELKTQAGRINFYGTNIAFEYDNSFIKDPSNSYNEKVISDYWKEMCQADHGYFIDQMQDHKTDMNLNDWGYYLLIKKASEKIFTGSGNQSNLFVWYMLSKSGYKCKIGYNKNKVYLLIPSANTLYGLRYYTFNNLRYYAMDPSDGNTISTFKEDYPDADKIMDLHIRNSLNIGNEISERSINFNYHGEQHSFSIKYNTNSVKFYKEYPLTDLKIFFDASVSRIAKESLAENLLPLVEGKPGSEAVNLLLNFVQTSFKYKTDQEHLGKEKFYFPEELFYYPYSDCEDRSVLFAYLVKELLNFEVIGLKYPGHVATAVKFNNEIGGDYFIYNGQKYIVCDPTYLNAPAGVCMPQFANTEAEIIRLDNIQYNKELKDKIWDNVLASGGNHGSNKQNIVFDGAGNSYVTGYFNGEVNFGGYNFRSKNNSNDIFIAKYDKRGEVIWAKQAGGMGNDISYSITIDNKDNCYITGSFDSIAVFDDHTLVSKGNSDVFITKFDKNGHFIWVNKAGIDNVSDDVNFNYIVKYDPSGNHQWTKLYDETEKYENEGITIDPFNNCYVSGSLYASPGMDIDIISFNEYSEFDKIAQLKAENDRLVNNGYDEHIAGLFVVINYVGKSGSIISGETAQKTIDKYNPVFYKTSPNIYKNIGKLQFLKNYQGIITIRTDDKKDVIFDKIKIENNSKLITKSYKSGNKQIDVLSGIHVGKAFIWYDLNYIKLYKETGDMLFDYDDDHTQKTVNLKNDILD